MATKFVTPSLTLVRNSSSTDVQKPDVADLEEKTLQGEIFLIPKQYKLQQIIGRGSYGLVVMAVDTLTQEPVAIKKNKRIFPLMSETKDTKQSDAPQDPKALLRAILVPKRILRELKILSHLQHPNIVNMKEIFLPVSYAAFRDVYFVTELMEADLRDLLIQDHVLSDRQVQYIMYQILLAVAYIHSADVLHRDLKPENILVNSSCEIKICDFGLARGIDFEDDPTMSTNYVMTRWYRAPELLLNNQTVTKECDMWSVGCIMGELLGNDVLFKGTSPINQIERILKVLGTPNMDNVKGSPQGIEFVKKLGRYEAQDFSKHYPKANPLAVDLLEQMLQFNHEKRISAVEALKHPYFADIYDSDNMILHHEKFDFSFEKRLTSLEAVKKEAYDSILEFNGYVRARTPGVQTPQERRESMKLMKDLMSPHGGDRNSKRMQEQAQRELMPIMTKAEETGKEKRAKNTPTDESACFPKKTIMGRVKDMFKKKEKK